MGERPESRRELLSGNVPLTWGMGIEGNTGDNPQWTVGHNVTT